jgi:hypothetical protein
MKYDFEGPIRKIKTSFFKRIFGAVNERYLILSTAEGFFGYKRNEKTEKTKKFDLKFIRRLEMFEEKENSWIFGFKIFTEKKTFSLLVKTYEERRTWCLAFNIAIGIVPVQIPTSVFNAALDYIIEPFEEQKKLEKTRLEELRIKKEKERYSLVSALKKDSVRIHRNSEQINTEIVKLMTIFEDKIKDQEKIKKDEIKKILRFDNHIIIESNREQTENYIEDEVNGQEDININVQNIEGVGLFKRTSFGFDKNIVTELNSECSHLNTRNSTRSSNKEVFKMGFTTDKVTEESVDHINQLKESKSKRPGSIMGRESLNKDFTKNRGPRFKSVSGTMSDIGKPGLKSDAINYDNKIFTAKRKTMSSFLGN